MKMIRRRTFLAGAAALLSVGPARAQAVYPNRPIRLIVPFPPGGPLDVMGRLIAQRLSTTLGQVFVDNKPGAGGTLAGREAARSDPDGYTLLMGSSAALAIGPALYRENTGYDPLKSFVPVAMVSSVPYVMIAAANTPFKTVQEVLAHAKEKPGELNFGVPNGAPPHMLAEMFKMTTGANIVTVPYRGASTLITDMLAGRLQLGFETTSVMFGHLHEGKIRGLAVLRDKRLTELPDMPTMVESGVNNVIGSSWSGIVAPAGTPPGIVAKLRNEIVAGLRAPEVADRLKVMAADAVFMSQEEMAKFLADEFHRIGSIMRAANLKAD
jgi:tripartite-type tricarboxylate transporter receptor subunit TctC